MKENPGTIKFTSRFVACRMYFTTRGYANFGPTNSNVYSYVNANKCDRCGRKPLSRGNTHYVCNI